MAKREREEREKYPWFYTVNYKLTVATISLLVVSSVAFVDFNTQTARGHPTSGTYNHVSGGSNYPHYTPGTYYKVGESEGYGVRNNANPDPNWELFGVQGEALWNGETPTDSLKYLSDRELERVKYQHPYLVVGGGGAFRAQFDLDLWVSEDVVKTGSTHTVKLAVYDLCHSWWDSYADNDNDTIITIKGTNTADEELFNTAKFPNGTGKTRLPSKTQGHAECRYDENWEKTQTIPASFFRSNIPNNDTRIIATTKYYRYKIEVRTRNANKYHNLFRITSRSPRAKLSFAHTESKDKGIGGIPLSQAIPYMFLRDGNNTKAIREKTWDVSFMTGMPKDCSNASSENEKQDIGIYDADIRNAAGEAQYGKNITLEIWEKERSIAEQEELAKEAKFGENGSGLGLYNRWIPEPGHSKTTFTFDGYHNNGDDEPHIGSKPPNNNKNPTEVVQGNDWENFEFEFSPNKIYKIKFSGITIDNFVKFKIPYELTSSALSNCDDDISGTSESFLDARIHVDLARERCVLYFSQLGIVKQAQKDDITATNSSLVAPNKNEMTDKIYFMLDDRKTIPDPDDSSSTIPDPDDDRIITNEKLLLRINMKMDLNAAGQAAKNGKKYISIKDAPNSSNTLHIKLPPTKRPTLSDGNITNNHQLGTYDEHDPDSTGHRGRRIVNLYNNKNIWNQLKAARNKHHLYTAGNPDKLLQYLKIRVDGYYNSGGVAKNFVDNDKTVILRINGELPTYKDCNDSFLATVDFRTGSNKCEVYIRSLYVENPNGNPTALEIKTYSENNNVQTERSSIAITGGTRPIRTEITQSQSDTPVGDDYPPSGDPVLINLKGATGGTNGDGSVLTALKQDDLVYKITKYKKQGETTFTQFQTSDGIPLNIPISKHTNYENSSARSNFDPTTNCGQPRKESTAAACTNGNSVSINSSPKAYYLGSLDNRSYSYDPYDYSVPDSRAGTHPNLNPDHIANDRVDPNKQTGRMARSTLNFTNRISNHTILEHTRLGKGYALNGDNNRGDYALRGDKITAQWATEVKVIVKTVSVNPNDPNYDPDDSNTHTKNVIDKIIKDNNDNPEVLEVLNYNTASYYKKIPQRSTWPKLRFSKIRKPSQAEIKTMLRNAIPSGGVSAIDTATALTDDNYPIKFELKYTPPNLLEPSDIDGIGFQNSVGLEPNYDGYDLDHYERLNQRPGIKLSGDDGSTISYKLTISNIKIATNIAGNGIDSNGSDINTPNKTKITTSSGQTNTLTSNQINQKSNKESIWEYDWTYDWELEVIETFKSPRYGMAHFAFVDSERNQILSDKPFGWLASDSSSDSFRAASIDKDENDETTLTAGTYTLTSSEGDINFTPADTYNNTDEGSYLYGGSDGKGNRPMPTAHIVFSGSNSHCTRTLTVQKPDCQAYKINANPSHDKKFNAVTQNSSSSRRLHHNTFPVGDSNSYGGLRITNNNSFELKSTATKYPSFGILNATPYTSSRSASSGDPPETKAKTFLHSVRYTASAKKINQPGKYTISWSPKWQTVARNWKPPGVDSTFSGWRGIEHSESRSSKVCNDVSAAKLKTTFFIFAEPPSCRIKHTIFEVTDPQAKVEVIIRNPNNAPLKVNRAHYKVSRGTDVVTGSASNTLPALVPKNGQTTISSPLIPKNVDGEYDYSWSVQALMGNEKWTTVDDATTWPSSPNSTQQNSWFEDDGKQPNKEFIVGSNDPALSCEQTLRIVKAPYFKVFYGDIASGGNFGSNTGTNSCRSDTQQPNGRQVVGQQSNQLGYISAHSVGSGKTIRGSSAQYTVQALNKINGFYSASQRNAASQAPYPAKGLTLANKDTSLAHGGNFGRANCLPNYWQEDLIEEIVAEPVSTKPFDLDKRTPNPGTNRPDYSLPANQGKNIFRFKENVTLVAEGPDNILDANAADRPFKKTLYVEGDLYIKDDIELNQHQFTTPYDSSFIFIIVKGDIFIDPDVERLDAILVSYPTESFDGSPYGGRLYTCQRPSWSSGQRITNANHLSSCNKQLTVNGALIAESVRLGRIHETVRRAVAGEDQTTTKASEIINLLPEYIIGAPNGLPDFNDWIHASDSTSTIPLNF